METKTIEVDIAEDQFKNLRSPIKFLKENGKEGISIIRKTFSAIALITLTNAFLLIFILYQFVAIEEVRSKATYLILAVLVCVIFFAFGISKSYRYALISALSIAYKKMEGSIKKLCSVIINKVDGVFKKNANVTKKELKQVVNIQKITRDKFDKLPRFIVKGLTRIIYKIPMVEFIWGLKNEIISGDKETASGKLFTEIDEIITESLFEDNNRKWLLWYLPLNCILVLGIIFYKVV